MSLTPSTTGRHRWFGRILFCLVLALDLAAIEHGIGLGGRFGRAPGGRLTWLVIVAVVGVAGLIAAWRLNFQRAKTFQRIAFLTLVITSARFYAPTVLRELRALTTRCRAQRRP